jgi:hypothetical protein
MLEVCRKNVLFTTSISLGMLTGIEGQPCGERRARGCNGRIFTRQNSLFSGISNNFAGNRIFFVRPLPQA